MVSGACDMHGVEGRCIQDFGGGNLLEGSSHRVEAIIKMDLKNIAWNGMDWSCLTEMDKIHHGGLSTI
jgi:hypothetical protein